MGRFTVDRSMLPAKVGPWKNNEFINISFEEETRFRIALDRTEFPGFLYSSSKIPGFSWLLTNKDWSVSPLEPVPAMLAEHLTEQEWKDFIRSLYDWSEANLPVSYTRGRKGRQVLRRRVQHGSTCPTRTGDDAIEFLLVLLRVLGVIAALVGVANLKTSPILMILGIVVTIASHAIYGHIRRQYSNRMTKSLRDHLESGGGVNWKRELEARGCALEVGTRKTWCICWLRMTLFELTYDDLSEVAIKTPRRDKYTGGLPQLTVKVVVPDYARMANCIKNRVVVKAPGDGNGYWTLDIPKGATPGSTLVFTAPLPRRVKKVDTTGDGKHDSVAMDTNFDGNWDKVFAGTAIDTNQDGEQDSLAVDTTRDGQLDTVVALESGSAAQKKKEKLRLTRVGSRHFYLGATRRAVPMNLAAVRAEAVDSTGDGRVDSLVMDTIGDGKADRAFQAQMVDTTGDGKGDLVGVDITGDGQIDTLTTGVSLEQKQGLGLMDIS